MPTPLPMTLQGSIRRERGARNSLTHVQLTSLPVRIAPIPIVKTVGNIARLLQLHNQIPRAERMNSPRGYLVARSCLSAHAMEQTFNPLPIHSGSQLLSRHAALQSQKHAGPIPLR